jgi:hypothetical protein
MRPPPYENSRSDRWRVCGSSNCGTTACSRRSTAFHPSRSTCGRPGWSTTTRRRPAQPRPNIIEQSVKARRFDFVEHGPDVIVGGNALHSQQGLAIRAPVSDAFAGATKTKDIASGTAKTPPARCPASRIACSSHAACPPSRPRFVRHNRSYY